MDRASGFEPEGREFESLRARNQLNKLGGLRVEQFRYCYRFATTRRDQHARDLLGSFLDLLPHRVRVLIEREARRVVAGKRLHDFRIDPALEERRHEDPARFAAAPPAAVS